MSIVAPRVPSKDVARLRSTLSFGFSVGERIVEGRRRYEELYKMLELEQAQRQAAHRDRRKQRGTL